MAEESSPSKRVAVAVHKRHYNIHDNILMQVLARVPGESLLRFKCVSKHWYFLITSPYFVDLFLCTQSLETSALFVAYPLFKWKDKFFHMVNWKKKGAADNMVKIHAPSLPTDEVQYYITNTVNGLVCIYHSCIYRENFSFFIYNSTTREKLPIHPPDIDDYSNATCYLAFDPPNKQYKVVCTCSKLGHRNQLIFKCQVLTLGCKVNNTWRHVNVSHDPGWIITIYNDLNRGVCLDGVLYWRTLDHLGIGPNSIVAFNVTQEKFECIPYPKELIERYAKKVTEKVIVCQVGGLLSVADIPISTHSQNISIILWSKRVITCPLMITSESPSIGCSDFGLLTMLHIPISSNDVHIECYYLETGEYMVLNYNIDNALKLMGGPQVFKPSLFVENIISLKDI